MLNPIQYLLIPALSLCALMMGTNFLFARQRRALELETARRQAALQQELELHRRALQAVTGGRLVLCGAAEVQGMLEGERLWTLPLLEARDVPLFRQNLREIAARRGFSHSRLDDLCCCVSEAAVNAICHSQGGVAQVWVTADGFMVLVTDCGQGISAKTLLNRLESLPGTDGDAGMGFRLMLAMSDTLALSTSAEGTQLLLKIRNVAESPQDESAWRGEAALTLAA